MIAASEPQEFVPYGRQQMTRHPGAVVVPSTQPQLQPESFLIDRFSQVNIDSHTENEWWTLRSVPTTDKDVLIDNEEELYVAGKTAVLSHGITGQSIGNCGTELPAGRMLSRSYTTESNITQALWCNFVKPINQTEVISMPSVCLLDSTKVNIYTLEGEDFLSPLQFKIASAWNTKFGLLLERVSSPASSSPNFIPATLFSLLHPLDEMAPLFLLKQGGILSYMNDPCMKVVFTAEEPSLCVMFDVRTGLHSVWKLRKATNEECQLMCVENSLYSTQNQSSALFSNFSQSSSVSKRGSFANRSSLPNTGSSANFSSPFSCNSPMFSFSNSRTQSPLVTGVRSHSPGVKNTPTPPMSWSSRKAQFTMALGSPSTPPLDARLGTSHVVSETVYEPRPIMPELCLEYIWTENQGVSSFKNGETIQASRIFQISDVLGQSYLCYLLKPRNQLMCARLGKTNEKIPEVLIGAVSHIPAKDAAPLPSLKMIAVLEPSGGVCLYTGTTPVGKVHVAGINTALASSLYLSSVTAGLIANSPFPKRSSLLSSTKTGDALFDERVHLLSPVPSISYVSEQSDHDLIVTSTPRDGHLHALRDPVANRLTLEFLNGSMFRIAFPEVCSSPLVQECVRVLKTVLPKEVAILLVVKWYAARNAPGSQDISPHLEWELFNIVLLGLLGYDVDKLPLQLRVNMDVPETHMQVKKKKSADNGTDEDWTYLINSKYSDTNAQNISRLLGINRTLFRDDNIHAESTDSTKEIKGHINCSSPLFQYFHLILFSLHLLYEELKLNLLLVETLPMMSVLLQHLSRDMKLDEYVIHYWKDFPQTCILDNVPSQIEKEDLEKLSTPIYITTTPPSIFHQLYGLLQRHPGLPTYPYISQVNPRSKDMLQLVGMLCSGVDQLETLVQCVVPTGSRSDLNNLDKTILKDFIKHSKYTRTQRCVLLMNEMGYTRRDLTTLPAGLALILGDAIHRVREAPPADWPEPAYRLIDRQDLAATPPPPAVGERGSATPPPPAVTRNNQETDDGMESMDREILKLRFNKDQRVSDVRRLLQSSQPVTIAIQQRPEVSDHEFIEEQEKHLYAICTRTMALPVGRGMLTLHTACPVSSEPLSVPRLCTTGKAPPRGTTVELTHIEIVPNMSLWPMFHNGVAAGLRIAPSASNIDSTWIVYNKPKAGQTPDYLPEHAGFLMALGLNGHLKNLAQLNTFDYLTRCHEMTSVGLLLGIAATKRGTMDVETTKILSIHIESLLPPTSIELDIVQNIQVAALLSVGLVYQGTAHRHIAEVLLSEMGRPPGPEMENSVDRESYALAAGLGLGLVVLGRGSDVSGLNDLGIADTLHYYMIGGHKRPLTGSQKEKYKSPSYQIREGDCVNNDVTSPGATLALGMMYFKTGNMAVANWMKAPDTQYLLDFVCPDFLLLRMVARGLILWDEIIPSIGWVEQHVPTAIRPYCLVKPHPGSLPDSVDVETMNQAYCNILAGACMAMGLRFAGSCNQKAFKTLHHYCKMFTSLSGKSIAELAGKSTIETCLNVILLSLAMVMAGSGDLSVLRICRYLNSRVGQPNNSVVTYGSHLATHMALGLLFLGGGRYTLSTSPESIAAMLCAFFPKFPTHSNDNRYHLQAFRHLYVLAAESRLLLPRDIDTGSLCYAHVTVVYLDTEHYQNQSAKLKAPCLLPELKYLKEVRVEDDRYWTVVFRRDQNWSQLQNLLSGSVGVKQHVGCLSYIEDPHGFRSLLAQTLSTDKSVPWSVPAESIFAFSSDPSTVNFAHYFLEHGDTSTTSEHSELQLMQFLTKLVYECVTHDKLSIIPIWINIIKAIQSLEHAPSGILTWQLKLLIAQAISPCDTGPTPLVSPELALSVENQISTILDTWESTILSEVLPRYLQNLELQAGVDTLSKLAMYLNFYDFPPVYAIVNAVQGNWNILTMYMALQKYNLPYSTLRRIVSVLRKT